MAKRPSASDLEIWQRWLRANRVIVDRLDRELRARTGLTLEEYDVLVQLAQHLGGLRMSELAGALLVARSSCTRLVSSMEAHGLVVRIPDDDDRRVVWATLTRSGRARLRRAAVVHLAGVQSVFAQHVDPSDRASLRAFLDRLLEGSTLTADSAARRPHEAEAHRQRNRRSITRRPFSVDASG